MRIEVQKRISSKKNMYKEMRARKQLEERKGKDIVIHSMMYCSYDSINDYKSDKEIEMKIIGCVRMVKRSW